MFNIYVVLVGHDMVTDATRATTCRRKFKAPSLQTNCTKKEGPPENMGFRGKQCEDFRRKKRTETLFSTYQKKPVEHKDSERLNWTRPSWKVRSKLNKTWKKAFRSKLLELCKTRAKKSSPDMFNIYVVLAGHDMVTDASMSTTCRRNFKAPKKQTKLTKKMKDLRKKWVSTSKPFEDFRRKKNKINF